MKQHAIWTVIIGLAFSGATSGALIAAETAPDFEAEQKQIEKEDAEQDAEREKGIKNKYQVVFDGTVRLLSQADQELSPGVVGHFVTSLQDPKPGRAYLLKLAAESEALLNALKSVNGKPAQLTGKLRFIGANGEAKYLIVESVQGKGPTPTVSERRTAGGL